MSDSHRTYVEDADEEGNVMPDTRTYPSPIEPTAKEAREANVSRTLAKKDGGSRLTRRGSSSPAATTMQSDSESIAQAQAQTQTHHSPRRRESKHRSREKQPVAVNASTPKEKRRSGSMHISTTTTTTAAAAAAAGGASASSPRRLQDSPVYFGISPTATSPLVAPAGGMIRPRAYTANGQPQRPNSYYGPSASRPPPANAKYWPNPPLSPFGPPPIPPPYYGVPQYHPPPLQIPPPMPLALPMAPPSFPPAADYFSQSPRSSSRLAYRRPSSAMGDRHYSSPMVTHYHHHHSTEYDDDPDDGGVLTRKPSLRTRLPPREADRSRDRILMPPPPVPRRPSTSGPLRSHIFAPPSSHHSPRRYSATFDDDDDEDISHDRHSDDENNSLFTDDLHPSTSYEYRPHPARRPSFRDVDDKLSHAQRYQERIGGHIEQLTADNVRKHIAIPSHDTRSRGGGTTATGSEDISILLKGAATLTIGDAKMDVRDGAEIRIGGGERAGGGGSRSGGGGSVTTAFEERAAEETSGGPGARRRRARGTSRSRAALPIPPEYGGTQAAAAYQQQVPHAPFGSHGYVYPQF